MDSVIRGIVIYAFLLLVFRISGKRTLKDLTIFDFVLVLIIAETTQQALLGEDVAGQPVAFRFADPFDFLATFLGVVEAGAIAAPWSTEWGIAEVDAHAL